jgi:hypothetical protein
MPLRVRREQRETGAFPRQRRCAFNERLHRPAMGAEHLGSPQAHDGGNEQAERRQPYILDEPLARTQRAVPICENVMPAHTRPARTHSPEKSDGRVILTSITPETNHQSVFYPKVGGPFVKSISHLQRTLVCDGLTLVCAFIHVAGRCVRLVILATQCHESEYCGEV